MPPRRRGLMSAGQAQPASAMGSESMGMPSIPQGGRTGPRPASPMGGTGGGMTAIQGPPQAEPAPLPIDPQAGGPTSPFNIGSMLSPNQQPGQPARRPAPTAMRPESAPSRPMGAPTPFQGQMPGQMNAEGGGVANNPNLGQGEEFMPPVLLRLLAQMGQI